MLGAFRPVKLRVKCQGFWGELVSSLSEEEGLDLERTPSMFRQEQFLVLAGKATNWRSWKQVSDSCSMLQ